MPGFNKKTVRDVDVAGKRVLVRVDFNVPLKDGAVTDDTRIKAALPTIRYLIDHNARVILMSHLGRPAGVGFEEPYSLKPVARNLQRLVGRDVTCVYDIIGDVAQEAAANLKDGEIIMLDNLRFDPREKKNDPEFARGLANLADLYVNDAFGVSHRAHASVCGVTEYLPAVSGFLLAAEVETLTEAVQNPERPFVAILGGSKVSDKVGVIDNLLDVCDTLIIGGGMCFTFLKAKDLQVGTSIVEDAWVEPAKEMLAKADEKGVDLLLPIDFVVADAFAEDANTKIVGREEIPADMMGLDIGPATIAHYRSYISRAKTIFWNGPMGVFEMKAFEEGTKGVAAAVAQNSRAVSIIGGGDSVAAVKKFGLDDRVTFISTGGGASMKIVEGKTLPGVEALDDKE